MDNILDVEKIKLPPGIDEIENDIAEKTLYYKEEQSFEVDRIKNEIESQRLKNKTIEQKLEIRKGFTNKIYFLVVAWLIVVTFFIFASGCSAPFNLCALFGTINNTLDFSFFKLSDAVLLALLGTVTIDIIGLLVVIVKYFYNDK